MIETAPRSSQVITGSEKEGSQRSIHNIRGRNAETACMTHKQAERGWLGTNWDKCLSTHQSAASLSDYLSDNSRKLSDNLADDLSDMFADDFPNSADDFADMFSDSADDFTDDLLCLRLAHFFTKR